MSHKYLGCYELEKAGVKIDRRCCHSCHDDLESYHSHMCALPGAYEHGYSADVCCYTFENLKMQSDDWIKLEKYFKGDL